MSRTFTHRFSPSEAYRAFVKTGATLPDDLLSLPSVEISNYKSLPEISGVYFFLLDGEPLYVGESCNIRRRLSTHPMRQVVQYWAIQDRVRIGWIELSPEVRGGFQCAAIIKWHPPYGIDYGMHIVMDYDEHEKAVAPMMAKIHNHLNETRRLSDAAERVISYGVEGE